MAKKNKGKNVMRVRLFEKPGDNQCQTDPDKISAGYFWKVRL
jgi:hypothetical protein